MFIFRRTARTQTRRGRNEDNLHKTSYLHEVKLKKKIYFSNPIFSLQTYLKNFLLFFFLFASTGRLWCLRKQNSVNGARRIIPKTLIRVERSRTWGVFGDELSEQRERAFRGLNPCDKTKVAYYYNSSNRIYAKQRKSEGDVDGRRMLQGAGTLHYIPFHFHSLLPDFLEINMKLSKRFLVPVLP